MENYLLPISINGQQLEFLVPPHMTLLELLRSQLHMGGTKCGCDLGECGLCTVLLDGEIVLSCILLAAMCRNKKVVTIEGMKGKEFEAVRRAFVAEGAVQCGFCTPAMVMVLSHLLKSHNHDEVKEVLSGHLCRCTGYVKILKAYEKAREELCPKTEETPLKP